MRKFRSANKSRKFAAIPSTSTAVSGRTNINPNTTITDVCTSDVIVESVRYALLADGRDISRLSLPGRLPIIINTAQIASCVKARPSARPRLKSSLIASYIDTSSVLYFGDPPSTKTIENEVKQSRKMVIDKVGSVPDIAGNSSILNLCQAFNPRLRVSFRCSVGIDSNRFNSVRAT